MEKRRNGRETISIRLDPELWKEAKIYAIRNDVSIAELMEGLLREKINKK